MRSSPLLTLILPLSLVGAVCLSVEPELTIEPVRHALSADPQDSLEAEGLPIQAKTATQRAPVQALGMADEVPLSSSGDLGSLPHPDLPVNPLLSDDYSSKRLEKWYAGSPLEHLYTNLVRIEGLREWDPRSCSCAGVETDSQPHNEFAAVHEMRKKKHALFLELNWLRDEVRPRVVRTIKGGGDFGLLRLPQRRDLFMREIEQWTDDERAMNRDLMTVMLETFREEALEAELSAGRFKLDLSPG